jgi:hypothetical protein
VVRHREERKEQKRNKVHVDAKANLFLALVAASATDGDTVDKKRIYSKAVPEENLIC